MKIMNLKKTKINMMMTMRKILYVTHAVHKNRVFIIVIVFIAIKSFIIIINTQFYCIFIHSNSFFLELFRFDQTMLLFINVERVTVQKVIAKVFNKFICFTSWIINIRNWIDLISVCFVCLFSGNSKVKREKYTLSD